MRVKQVVVAVLFMVIVGGIVSSSWTKEVPATKSGESVAKTEKQTESSGQKDKSAKIRVGIYENRAIACAYAPSVFNPVAKKMEEYKKAKAEGNEKRCVELKAWGKKHQQNLHWQGFCAVPVDDLLVYVKDGLAKLAEKENLDLIVWRYDYKSKNVEIIDVTDQIVALYNPTAKTLRTVKEIQKHAPVSLDVIAKHGHEH